jgi:hypothetical protein
MENGKWKTAEAEKSSGIGGEVLTICAKELSLKFFHFPFSIYNCSFH